ncbi:MAG TPA: ornithine cyclodeaminase family protein [Gaiellaceae bacterium]|nr:ornithine cyclodeaminase family protein [Gaiellaceae bacterium]
MLVLSRAEVEELLDLDELTDALARAHVELSAGAASMPPRIAALAGDAGLLGAMPAYLPSAGLGCKLVSLFPGNVDRPTHQAEIVVFDPENGSPVAVMDGTYITAMRTAAAAALAAGTLAREDARVLAVLGTGVQSRAAQEMFPRVRDFAEIRVAGRGEYEDAVRGADVVHATTHSPDPVVLDAWLEPGAHVSSVGYNAPGSELDPAIVARADVICIESRGSAFAPPPSGAPELAGLDPERTVELGEVLAGTRPGRTSAEQLTLYKSVGVAVQDLAAAGLVLAAAEARA